MHSLSKHSRLGQAYPKTKEKARFTFRLAFLTAFLLLGGTPGSGQVTDWYLHWNSGRCGPLKTAQWAWGLSQPPFTNSPDSRRDWLPSLSIQPYSEFEHSYLKDVFLWTASSGTPNPPWLGDSCIDFFERVPIPKFCGMPDDPGLTGLLGTAQTDLEFLRVPESWDLLGEFLPDTNHFHIGVVDTWVDTLHEDLRGMVDAVGMIPSSLVHGTAVAGLAGAMTNNTLGIASAAYGSRLSVEWKTDLDYAVLDLARGGAKVIAVPWINRCSWSPVQQAIYNQARDLGALVIASAGNGKSTAGCGDDGQELAYPASLQNVLSISSVGHRYARGSVDSVLGAWNWRDVHNLYPLGPIPITHTHNDSVDLVAPGHGLLTTVPGNGYAEAWGTSFSAPVVAGIARLVLTANPCLSPGEVESILKSTACQVDTLPENLEYLGKLGSGRVDAYAAVQRALGETSVDLVSGEHPDWEGVLRIRENVILEPGARLTIRGKVYFAPGASVLLKPGSRLVLEGAELLSGCGESWAGIRVQGIPDLPHPPAGMVGAGLYPSDSGYHAVLEIRSGTLISGADTAILSYDGGIVQGYDSELRDNTIAFVLYDFSFPQVGFLRNCHFSWMDRTPLSGETLTLLSNSRGFSFQGCTWSSAHWTPETRALQARDAGFTLKSGPCAGGPCTSGSNGLIEGFDVGIEAWTTTGITPAPVLLSSTAIRNCRRGILLRGLDAPELRNMTLTVPASAGLGYAVATYGVHLEACRSTVMNGCSITGLGANSLGIVLYDGGNYPAEISNCSLDSLYAAVVVLGRNGNVYSGMQLRCNAFAQNHADVWLAPGLERPSLARHQGSCYYQPAGNQFQRSSSTPGWVIDSSSVLTWYFHQDGAEFTPQVVDTTLFRVVSCEREYRTSDCPAAYLLPLVAAPDSIRALDLLAEQIEATFDNGSTSDLLRLIAAPGIGSGVLQFALSEANPYLSDTVLLALVNRYPDVAVEFFRHILLSNSPLSDPVLAAALAALPASVHRQLQSFQTGLPNTRELLRAQIASLRMRLARWEYRRLIPAWSSGKVDSLLLWSQQDPDRLASLLASFKSWPELDELLISPGADTLSLSPVLQILANLNQDGRSQGELTPTEQMVLESVAAEGSRGGVVARNMLRAFDGRIEQEPLPLASALLFTSDRSSSRASMKQSDLQFGSENGPGDHKVRVFPNPAGDRIFVQGMEKASYWVISDSRGITQLSGNGESAQTLEIDLKSLAPGVYILQIYSDHFPSQIQRFIKME